MNRFLLPLLLAALAFAHSAAAAPVIDLWPEGVPGLHPGAGQETDVGGTIGNVNHPTLTLFAPSAGRSCGTAVIVCPGGGYSHLALSKEGSGVAAWLNRLGVTAFVLRYRMKEYGQPAPLQDVLRAVRLVRSRAAEFGVRPDRIGVFGSSAGGHLAACAGTLYDDPTGRTGAPLDAVSGRPDFLMLLYPVITMRAPYAHAGSRRNLLGPNPSTDLIRLYSVEEHVSKDTPPVFIVATEEDKSVPVENSLMFYQALRRAGVPVEMHLYVHGPHGFGMRPGLGTTSEWPQRAEDWLRANGWIPAVTASAAAGRG